MLSSFSLALKIWAEGAMLPCPMLVFFQKVPYEICILVPKFAKKMPMHPLQLTKSHLAPSKLFFWLCPWSVTSALVYSTVCIEGSMLLSRIRAFNMSGPALARGLGFVDLGAVRPTMACTHMHVSWVSIDLEGAQWGWVTLCAILCTLDNTEWWCPREVSVGHTWW
jgi:hypothetical protein